MSTAPEGYVCDFEGCDKTFSFLESKKYTRHVRRCTWGKTPASASSAPVGGRNAVTPTAVKQLFSAPGALQESPPTAGKQLFVFKEGDAGAKGVARARESSCSDNGCAATALLYAAMCERQQEVWRGQCNVPCEEGDDTATLDLLRDFDFAPNGVFARKPDSPSAAFLKYDIRCLRKGVENHVLTDPRFSISAHEFEALSPDDFVVWRGEVQTYVRALFLNDGQEISVIKTGNNFVVFGCRRSRHYAEAKGASC